MLLRRYRMDLLHKQKRKGIVMNDSYFMGYKIHKNIKHFLPNTILFSNEKGNITVAMAKDALDYILSIIATRNPLVESYNTAKTVFNALKMILDNKKPARLSNADMKTAVDVLKEIANSSAKSEEEKEGNAKAAFVCKLMIDGFSGKSEQ